MANILQGPGATWSSGTLLPSIETTVEYSVKMMKKIQHDNIRSIAVTQQALNEIYEHFDEFHKTTVWQEECRSWFKDGKQKNRIYLWPGPVSAAAPPHHDVHITSTPLKKRIHARRAHYTPYALVSFLIRHCIYDESSPPPSWDMPRLTSARLQTIHFLKSIKDPRFEDYDIRWRYRNRFAYLGEGEVKANKTKDVAGLSPYVRDHDHEWGVE